MLAQSDVPKHPLGAEPESVAYFCATCGEIWARVLVEGSASARWLIEQSPCERHRATGVPDWMQTPGSLVQGRLRRSAVSVMFWAATLESLPLPLQNREVALHLKDKERSIA